MESEAPDFDRLTRKNLPRRIRLRNRNLIFYLRRANAEKLRKIMLSEELSESEKLDRLHALIPPDAVKIDNLNQATPAQLRQLKDGLAVTEAMQQIRRAELPSKNSGRLGSHGLDGESIRRTTFKRRRLDAAEQIEVE